MRTWSLRAQHKTTAPTTTTILFGIGERSHVSLSSPLGPGHFVDSSGRQRQEGLLPAHLAGGAIPQPCPREGGEEPDLLLLVAWAGQALLLDVLPKRVMWGRNRGLFSKSQTFNNVFASSRVHARLSTFTIPDGSFGGGPLDASLRPWGGVWGYLGSNLWWGGTGIRTPDLLHA